MSAQCTAGPHTAQCVYTLGAFRLFTLRGHTAPPPRPPGLFRNTDFYLIQEDVKLLTSISGAFIIVHPLESHDGGCVVDNHSNTDSLVR